MIPQWAKEEIERVKVEREKVLNLSGKERDEKLSEFPESILELEWIGEIILANNEIKEIPGDLSQLKQLRFLDVRGNYLTTVPIVKTNNPISLFYYADGEGVTEGDDLRIAHYSDKFLTHLIDLESSIDGYARFKVRKTNRASRLSKGYWFLGSSNYISIGIYKPRDTNNRTSTFHLVFGFDKNFEPTEAFFELTYRSDEAGRQIKFYEDLMRLPPFEGKWRKTAYNKYSFDLKLSDNKTYKQVVDEAFKFYLPHINRLVSARSLDKEFFIDEKEFEEDILRILIYRRQSQYGLTVLNKDWSDKVSASEVEVESVSDQIELYFYFQQLKIKVRPIITIDDIQYDDDPIKRPELYLKVDGSEIKALNTYRLPSSYDAPKVESIVVRHLLPHPFEENKTILVVLSNKRNLIYESNLSMVPKSERQKESPPYRIVQQYYILDRPIDEIYDEIERLNEEEEVFPDTLFPVYFSSSSFAKWNEYIDNNCSYTLFELEDKSKESPKGYEDYELLIDDYFLSALGKLLINDTIQNSKDSLDGKVMGIIARWGRGKTHLAKKIEEKLNATNNIWVDFSAWRYQDTPAIWAYLYEELSSAYFNGNGCENFWRGIKLNCKRFSLWQNFLYMLILAVSFGGLACIVVLSILLTEIEELPYYLLSGTAITILWYLQQNRNSIKQVFQPGRNILSKYSDRVSFEQALGLQSEIQKEINHLIAVWSEKNKEHKIILFVDDLDRCNEERLIQIIDALRIVLENPSIAQNLVIIVALDNKILTHSIVHKLNKLGVQFSEKKEVSDSQKNEEKEVSNSQKKYAREYIEKIFHHTIHLPPLSKSQKVIMLEKIGKNDWHDKIDYKDFPESISEFASKTERVQIVESLNEYNYGLNPRKLKILLNKSSVAKTSLKYLFETNPNYSFYHGYIKANLYMPFFLDYLIKLSNPKSPIEENFDESEYLLLNNLIILNYTARDIYGLAQILSISA